MPTKKLTAGSRAQPVLRKEWRAPARKRQRHQQRQPLSPTQQQPPLSPKQQQALSPIQQQAARSADARRIEQMERKLRDKEQHLQAMGSELKLAGEHFDTSMVQLDRVQRDLFTALEKEKKKRQAAEQEVRRLKMALAMIAHNQHQATQFTLGLAASAFGGMHHPLDSMELVERLSMEPPSSMSMMSASGGGGGPVQFLGHS